MKREKYSMSVALVLAVALISTLGMTGKPAFAAECIPAGTTIDSATFFIYVSGASGQLVQVHRVTAPWSEADVTWNNFAMSFAPAVEGSFVADTPGWRSVDLTALVQAWVDGVYENDGILLEQGLTNRTWYPSSENGMLDNRPKLEICYDSTCITIQRPSTAPDDVADATISEGSPDTPQGLSSVLLTGEISGLEKQTLVWFDICEGGNGDCLAPKTPGYWKTHPDAWPVSTLTLGGQSYSMTELLILLWKPVKGDASIILAHHLIAAKLNIAEGTDPAPINDTITSADSLLSGYSAKLPLGVKANTVAGQEMITYASALDDYNNGLLTPPCVP